MFLIPLALLRGFTKKGQRMLLCLLSKELTVIFNWTPKYLFCSIMQADCFFYLIYFQFLAATVFAYGQTSSGKTYTMQGITENAIKDIYEYIEEVVCYISHYLLSDNFVL